MPDSAAISLPSKLNISFNMRTTFQTSSYCGKYLAIGLLAAVLAPSLAFAVTEPTATAASSAQAATGDLSKNDDYMVAPRDSIQFQIYDDTDLQSTQRVSGSGEISVPMLGTVKVGGLTLRQAERLLEKMYVDGGYYIKPQVILSVQTYVSRSVSVLGQVNHPDHIEFPIEQAEIGVVQAITLAGGFTRVAKVDGVRIMRKVDGKEQQFTINVSDYLDSKNGAGEFKLQAEDIVYVPERVF